MNKKIKFFASCLAVFIVLFAIFAFVIHNKNDNKLKVICVPTEEIATEIGKTICTNAYPDIDYTNCAWKAFYNEKKEVWLVYGTDKSKKQLGGLPQVVIKKENAQVLMISLQA